MQGSSSKSGFNESMPLTPREKQVMDLLLQQGLSNKEIGSRLHISERTAKFHLHNIFAKTGISGRLELVIRYKPAPIAPERKI